MAFETLSKHTRVIRRNLIFTSFITISVNWFGFVDKKVKIPFFSEASLEPQQSQLLLFFILGYLFCTFLIYFIGDIIDGGNSSFQDSYRGEHESAKSNMHRFLDSKIQQEWVNGTFIRLDSFIGPEHPRNSFIYELIYQYKENRKQSERGSKIQKKPFSELFEIAWKNQGFNEAVIQSIRGPQGNSDLFDHTLQEMLKEFDLTYGKVEARRPSNFFRFKSGVSFFEGGIPIGLGLFSLWYTLGNLT